MRITTRLSDGLYQRLLAVLPDALAAHGRGSIAYEPCLSALLREAVLLGLPELQRRLRAGAPPGDPAVIEIQT